MRKAMRRDTEKMIKSSRHYEPLKICTSFVYIDLQHDVYKAVIKDMVF